MQLEKLFIRRSEWGKDKGQLSGKVEFTGPYGEVALPLDEETSRQIISVCANAIVRASQDVAEKMTADVLDGLALPAPEEG